MNSHSNGTRLISAAATIPARRERVYSLISNYRPIYAKELENLAREATGSEGA